MSDRLIRGGQAAALALAGAYACVLLFAGPLSTVFPGLSAPAQFAGSGATPLAFAYGGAETPNGFRFEAEMTEAAFDDLVARLQAPRSGSTQEICGPLDRRSRPKFALGYQCARWDGDVLLLEQRLAEDGPALQRQEIAHAEGRLIWRLIEF